MGFEPRLTSRNWKGLLIKPFMDILMERSGWIGCIRVGVLACIPFDIQGSITLKGKLSRRCFLSKIATGAAGLLILRDSQSVRGVPSNEKINVAIIGIGGRGRWFLDTIPRMENVVALCDVDNRKLTESVEAAESNEYLTKTKPKKYQDFRRMLDEMGNQIDAVIVATPDHAHAVIAATAMKKGKHVYVEKPIAHDVAEARALPHIAKQRKVATQMGNQGMATDSFRRTLELIEEGAVGEIREAHVWYVFGGPGQRERPKEKPPVPEYLDWNLWLGPASFRPYHPRYVSGWGAWRDFGTGLLGGGGSHSINLAFKALKLGALWEGVDGAKGQIRVESETPKRCIETFPSQQILRFDFPARGPLPPVRINWYNAPERELQRLGIWQRLEQIVGRSLEWKTGWTPRSGSLLVGNKGVVHTNAHNSLCSLLPMRDFPNSGGPPQKLPHVESHLQEWIKGCKGGPVHLSNFDHAGPVVELLLLGNVSTLVGQMLEFDPIAMKVVNNTEADALLSPEHRQGWSL